MNTTPIRCTPWNDLLHVKIVCDVGTMLLSGVLLYKGNSLNLNCKYIQR